MSRANRIALLLLGALMLLGLVWYASWFLENYEWRNREVRIDVSPQAKRNQFLAAERFLQRMGVEAESISGRDVTSNLPPVEDTLIVQRLNADMSDEQLVKLIDWIEAGGYLVVTPLNYWSEDNPGDPLLADMGVRLVAAGDEVTDCDETSDAKDERIAQDECADSEEDTDEELEEESYEYDAVQITLDDLPKPLEVRFQQHRYLEDAQEWSNWRVGKEDRYHLLQYTLEEGVVTIISDYELFENEEIGKKDHAYLLALLTNGSRKVWLQYSIDMPGLPALLWQRMPFLVVLGVLLLVLSGWRLLLSMGPELKLADRSRRNLLEHIDASAEFAWQVDKGKRLFNENRATIEHGWRRRHPMLNKLPVRERCEWIGEKTGLTASAIEKTLYGDVDEERDFIRTAAVLQRLTTGLREKREIQ